MARRPSPQTMAVLTRLLSEPDGWHYGYDIVRDLQIPSGTVYPILMRLHDRDILETKWEDSALEGRPRRHMYRLSDEGKAWTRSVTSEGPLAVLRPDFGQV